MTLRRTTLEHAIAQHYTQNCEVLLYESLPSTNRFLVDKLADELAQWQSAPPDTQSAIKSRIELTTKPQSDTIVCVTNRQTAGVGRRGRTWHSPQNSITFSVQKSFALPPAALMGLSLVAGITVAEVLSAYTSAPISVKWPNDLLVNDRKLGGILIELPLQDASACISVTGIGINFANGPEHRLIDQPFATLSDFLEGETNRGMPDKSDLIGTLSGSVLSAYTQFAEQGWRSFAKRWQQRDYLAGKPINVQVGNETHRATALGVADDGGLIVQQGRDSQTWYSGEVSVRLRHETQ